MTLTSIMPSLRRSIPDPLNPDRWPEFTHPTTDDVVVAGVSLTALTALAGSPCVHTAAAVVPGTHGRPSATEGASTVVATVTRLEIDSVGTRHAFVDCRFGHLPVIWSEMRLIGRASTVRGAATVLRPDDDSEDAGHLVFLPGDLVEGDLVVVPCPGYLVVRAIRCARRGDMDAAPLVERCG
ncbi:hypothetical protein ACFSBZ_04560 [Amnibacterium flavum]|uniref:Uncharacterized protein n=1 Tax=Amnibacterium flavum TaxID=2173173 RepID=A0A2V1HVQ1_9MICO|nr:hypothetical protein [Amnibacterium flavum]PVZ94244.1 hypothetical protein DDQ50_10910 [Amnibacterium flavum]